MTYALATLIFAAGVALLWWACQPSNKPENPWRPWRVKPKAHKKGWSDWE